MIKEPLKPDPEARLADQVVENLMVGERTRLDFVSSGDLELIEESLWADEFLDAIELIMELQTKLDHLTAACVAGARHQGVTWANISEVLGVRLQSAWERYREVADRGTDAAMNALREAEEAAAAERGFLDELLHDPRLTDEQRAMVRRNRTSGERAARSIRATLRKEGSIKAPVRAQQRIKKRAAEPTQRAKKGVRR